MVEEIYVNKIKNKQKIVKIINNYNHLQLIKIIVLKKNKNINQLLLKMKQLKNNYKLKVDINNNKTKYKIIFHKTIFQN